MDKIGELLKSKAPETEESSPDMADDSEESGEVSKEELSAMKLFESATSTEEKADALKMFIKACA